MVARRSEARVRVTTHWLGAGMLAAAKEAPPRSSAMRWRALAPALGLYGRSAYMADGD